jgi:hypothetical protein
MKKSSKYIVIMLGLMVSGIFFVELTAPSTKMSYGKIPQYSAGEGDLIYSENVTLGNTHVKRGIEAISIEFQNDKPERIYTYIANITLSDGTQKNITLSNASVSSLWIGEYIPSISDPLGQVNISIMMMNGEIIDNPDELGLDGSFIIENNLPSIGVSMNITNREIYREEILKFDFTPSDVEDYLVNLTWNIAIYNKTGSTTPVTTLLNNVSNILSYEFIIPASYQTGIYYVKATVWDTENDFSIITHDFTILNYAPVIDAYRFENLEGVDISAEQITVLRNSTITLKMNVSDADYHSGFDLLMQIIAKDPTTGDQLFFADYDDISLTNDDWNFTRNITFNSDFSVGLTELTVIIFEEDNKSIQSTIIQKILIKNNAPTITEYLINGMSPSEAKLFNEGELLLFTFVVSDVEESIRYIEVSLSYINETSGNTQYFNYSIPYVGESTTLSIRAVDLPTGTYTVYIFVFDEATSTKSAIAYQFEIVIENSFQSITWLMFGVGIILGGAIALGIGYSFFRGGSFIKSPSIETDQKLKKGKKSKNQAASDAIPSEDTNESIEVPIEPEVKSDQKSKKKKLIRKL